MHEEGYACWRRSQRRIREDPGTAAGVREYVVEAEIVSVGEKLVRPEGVRDGAIVRAGRRFAEDAGDAAREVRQLTKRCGPLREVTGRLLVRAADTAGRVSDRFVRLAREPHEELARMEQRMHPLQAARPDDGREPPGVLELAQSLPEQYRAYSEPRKRLVVDSVSSNFRLDNATLCADFRLPFAIPAVSDNHPLKSGWVDDFRTAVIAHPIELDLVTA